MPKFCRTALIATFLSASVLGTSGASEPNQFIGFGDSTLDSGYFRYNSTNDPNLISPTPYTLDQLIQNAVNLGAQGGFAGNGVMGSTMLADKFGLSAAPYGVPGGGTNYANGGGFTNAPGPLPGSVSAVQQIENYLASVNNVANPQALYVISSGNNDLLQYQKFPADFLSTSASALASEVAILQAAGARTILAPNSFMYAVYAGTNGNIVDPTNAADYARAAQYNVQRWVDLTAAGVHFIPGDLDSLFRHVVHNPIRFGFSSNSVLANQAPVYSQPSPYNSALLADDLDISPIQQQTYLFIDGKHLTTAGQTIEADYEYSLLIAPSQISLLAESAVQRGWAHAATIQGQLDPEGRQCRPCGRNAWASLGASSLNVGSAKGFSGDSGTPFGGSVGVDYQTCDGIVFGAAFASGSQSPGFSTGGHFNQVDEAMSLYAGYVGGPFWGNAVLTYDLFQYDIDRPVPLGIFTDQNFSSTTGQSLSLALRGGFGFDVGPITTGPVMGLMLQEVQIYDFTEIGDSGVTALSFAHQTRDSLVSQLGWLAYRQCGRLRPFAEVNWNHECAAKNRTITTSLTSVVAPSYTMDAAPVVSDWGTTSLGAFYQLNSRIMLRGAFSAMYMNPQMITAGGDCSLNFCF